jgi:cytochrome P450
MTTPVESIPLKQPPAFPPGWIAGNALEFRRDPLTYLLRNERENGDIAMFRVGPFTAYQFTHPDHIYEVLLSQADQLQKARIYKRGLSEYLGNGLLISDGSFWKRQRKLAQPAFHMKRINTYADVMVQYTQELLKTWRPGQVLNLSDEMMHVTLRIVAKTLFDTDITGSSDKVAEALEVMLHSVTEYSRSIIKIPEWIPTPARRRKRWSIETMDAIIMQIIQARRASGEDSGDLLSMLMQARDDEGAPMSDRQLHDEALTIVLAGHETTANALTWTLYLLSQNPDIEAKLYEEVSSVLGDRTATLADVERLVYTEQVVKEGMRLYPPAWSLGRQINKGAKVEIGGYVIPERTSLIVASYVTHRDPRWFPDPERFDPERFTSENEKALPRYAYFPFGGGPRICIGNSFAMMEAKLILATIVQKHRLTLVPGHPVVPEPLITLRPKYGMKMVAQGR